jgi:putative N6-adenine-specific DNA methylase
VGRAATFTSFAVTPPGFEPIVRSELAGLRIAAREESGGAAWEGGLREIYSANLHLRSASRILVRVAVFRARSFIEMERYARRIDWSPFLSRGTRVRLRVASRKSRLYHERAIAERLGRFLAEDVGTSVSADATDDDRDEEGGGDQLIVVRVYRDECTVSADSSGALLHRRGYRQAVAKAPLRETLAAGLLLSCGWSREIPLVDPFCGSGTIPIEAALYARNIPSGLASAGVEPRAFAFHRWPGFETETWGELLTGARAGIREHAGAVIRASDRDAGAIEAARANALRAGVGDDIEFTVVPLSSIAPLPPRTWMITNPPYGVRIGEGPPLRSLYAAIGHVARERLQGGRVVLVSGDDTLDRQVGLEWTELLQTRNGGIPIRFLAGDIGPAAAIGRLREGPDPLPRSSRPG